jgi:tRNA(Ile)-lysidine synthase
MLLYHVAVHQLAKRVLDHVRLQELLRAGDRVGVAVSGGIDSVALLRLLLEVRAELGIVLSVVHFNHKLRGAESDGDEEFVTKLARQYDLEFHCDSDEVAEHAKAEGVSVETAARELRYGFFRRLLDDRSDEPQALDPDSTDVVQRGFKGVPFHGQAKLDKIATGHTLDDQVETVLMRVIRGAGLKGLAGIYPRIEVEDDSGEFRGEIVRPLLPFRRRDLEQYLKEIGEDWREDATNADTLFTRNRVRKLLIPLLEKEFNPAVVENITELAEIARGEEDYWENEVAGWMGTGVHWTEPEWARSASANSQLVQIGGPGNRVLDAEPVAELQSKIESVPWLVINASVDLIWLLGEPVAVQRRIIKAIGERAGIPLEFKHVEEILRFATEEIGSGKRISLPLGWKVEKHPHELVFVTPDLRESDPVENYEYDLAIPGRVTLPEIGLVVEAQRIPSGEHAGYNPEHLLDAGSLPGPLKVRNWRAGDRFWPQHTKSPKKIKELLQERHAPLPKRKLWPVVVSGNDIVWMRGFPPPARFAPKPGSEAVLILANSLGSEGA